MTLKYPKIGQQGTNLGERHVDVDEVMMLQSWSSSISLNPFLIIILAVGEVLKYNLNVKNPYSLTHCTYIVLLLIKIKPNQHTALT